MAHTKRIAVYFSEEEYEAIKREAGMVPLARWVKEKLLHDGTKGNRAQRVQRVGVDRPPGGSAGFSSEERSVPRRAGADCGCGHARHEHGGFGGACQHEGCLCLGVR